MSIRKAFCSLAVISLTAIFITPAAPRGRQQGARSNTAQQAPATQQVTQVSPQLQVLSTMIGNWNFNMSVWESPDSPPEPASGSASFNWALGGTSLQGQYSGQISSKTFNGLYTFAYDQTKQQYVVTWQHSFSPATQETYTGQAMTDSAGNVTGLTYNAQCGCDCGDASQNGSINTVLTFVNNNSFVEQQYFTPDSTGTQFKAAEATYTRVQSAPAQSSNSPLAARR